MRKKTRFQPQQTNKSAMHRRVRDLLHECYPAFTILEEEAIDVHLDGRQTKLFIDLVLLELKVAVECHGQQHYRFTPHFHAGPEAFTQQQRRDAQKAASLRDSGYTLVVIGFDEYETLTPLDLMARINQALKESLS